MFDFNNIMVFDFETKDTSTGKGTLRLWDPTSIASSCAFLWVEDKKPRAAYRIGEDAIRAFLLSHQQYEYVAHNLQFEYMVLKCRFPEFPHKQLKYDTMRLVQVADGGGEEYDYFTRKKEVGIDNALLELEEKEVKQTHGLSLEKTARRWLNEEFQDHKAPAHDWIRSHVPGVKKGHEGEYLQYLPDDLLKSYNIADVKVTWKLFTKLVRYLESERYNWQFDHKLYNFAARMNADAEIRGVRTDRQALESLISAERIEYDGLLSKFREQHKDAIDRVEEKHRKPFNLGSGKDKEALFCGELGLIPRIKTHTGKPSFNAKHLAQWGDAAKYLKKRGTHLITINQATNAYWASETDGRVHFGLKSVGTRSDRFAGGSHGS